MTRGRGPHDGTSTPRILEELSDLLDRAQECSSLLSREMKVGAASDLAEQLARAEAENEEMATRLVQAEKLAGRLMSLYVAIFQLHDTLDPDEVRDNIAEIAIDLLGAEKVVVMLSTVEEKVYEVSLSRGLSPAEQATYGATRYRGGVALLDQTLEDGVMRFGSGARGEPVVVVPLTVQARTVGAMVLLQLLEHKPALLTEDRELLDLLAAHAASALMAARAYAAADRRVHSLESLIKLVKQ